MKQVLVLLLAHFLAQPSAVVNRRAEYMQVSIFCQANCMSHAHSLGVNTRGTG
jgi:hypothetical protein